MLYKEEKEIRFFIFWEEIKLPLLRNKNKLNLESQVLLLEKLIKENLVLRHRLFRVRALLKKLNPLIRPIQHFFRARFTN
jgi:hypothetical protein